MRARSSAASGTHGQLHERRQADVGGQVEVGEHLVRPVPAVARSEVDGRPVVGTLGHGGPPETGRARAAGDGLVADSCGRRRFGMPSSGARRVDRVRSLRPRRGTPRHCPAVDERRVEEQVERRLRDERRREQRRLVGARASGGVAELDRVARRRARR